MSKCLGLLLALYTSACARKVPGSCAAPRLCDERALLQVVTNVASSSPEKVKTGAKAGAKLGVNLREQKAHERRGPGSKEKKWHEGNSTGTSTRSGLPHFHGDSVKVHMPAERVDVIGLQSGDIATFFGIPFAAPPVHDRRWRSPQPTPRPPSGEITATRPRPNCPQPEFPQKALAHPEWGSAGAWPSLASGPSPDGKPVEDCLYLNLFAPMSAINDPSRKLPVLVWLPGGMTFFGGANDEHLDGRALARTSDALVVTFNYRLGVLGYAWHPTIRDRNEDPSTPMLAHQDQQAVLRWVQRNAAAFGGDRHRVTMGGESSAALDIVVHLLNPRSTPLFHRAVMSSPGEMLGPNSFANTSWKLDPSHRWDSKRSKRWEDAWAGAFAKAVTRGGSQCNQGTKSTVKVDIECLFSLSAESLDPFAEYALDIPDFPYPPSWIVDTNIPSPKIPVMIGMNGGDGSFANLENERVHWLRKDAKLMDFQRWASESFGVMGRHLASAYGVSEPLLAQERYTDDYAKFELGYRLGTAALLDWGYVCPAFEAASIFQGEGMDTYIYKFDRAPHDTFLLCDDVNCDGQERAEDFAAAGSCHGCDVPFWFMNSDRLSEDEMGVSRMMVSYLANFMRTGSPNLGTNTGQKNPEWPRVLQHPSMTTPSEEWLRTWKPPAPSAAGIMLFGSPLAEAQILDLEAHSHCEMWSQIALDDRTREQELEQSYVNLIIISLVMTVLSVMAPLARAKLHRWQEDMAQQRSGGAPESVMLGPPEPFPEHKTVPEIFQGRAEQQPGVAALEMGEAGTPSRVSVTYAELHERVVAAAQALRALGAGPGVIVPVVMERGISLVAGVMGVLEAGAAWAAVDPHVPEERQLTLLRGLKAPMAIAQVGTQVPSPTSEPLPVVRLDALGVLAEAPAPPAQLPEPQRPGEAELGVAERTAMIVFTSGSTGEPKGVVYPNRMLMHGTWFYGKLAGMSPGHRAFLKSPHIWAVIEYELFPPLLFGATMFIAKPNGHKQPAYIASCIAHEKLDSLMITPRVLEPVLDELTDKGLVAECVLKHCICIGEALRGETALNFLSALQRLAPKIHNVYGPSEASCTVWSSPPGRPATTGFVLAGRPQPHVRMQLLRLDNGVWSPVPEGQEGEIYIGGVIASGYLNRPEETEAKFVEVPGAEGRLYGTGDLGRFVNGELQVLGRIDRQLNVNGVRIEPGEVEASLKQVAKEACVVAAGEPEKLVALCVPRDGKAGDTEAAQRACAARLPEYMVPKVMEWQEQLPSLPNGKVDIRQCKARAQELVEKLAEEEGEIVDSLGIRRNMSKSKMIWQSATWACYAYWSLGVVMDHWMGCSPKSWKCETLAYLLPNWGELTLRSLGNVQDMCGFLVLGAFHDAQDEPKNATKLGIRELVVWALHLLTFAVIPLINRITPWQTGYPNIEESNIHRWYLWMYVLARLELAFFTRLHVPPIAQVVLMAFCAYIAPTAGILDVCAYTEKENAWHRLGFFLFPSYCQDSHHHVGASAVRELSHGNGCTCAVTGQMELAYMAFYLAAFHGSHYLKQLPKSGTGLFVASGLLTGLTIIYDYAHLLRSKYALVPELVVIFLVSWACQHFAEARNYEPPAVLLLGMCLFSQLTVSQFYYAMDSLETGRFTIDTPLQFLICTAQPLLLISAALKAVTIGDDKKMGWLMSLVKLAGGSALGSYMFHYYFTPTAVLLVHHGAYALSWATFLGPFVGVLQFIWVVAMPLGFVLIAGPFFQFLLTLPVRMAASRMQAQKPAKA